MKRLSARWTGPKGRLVVWAAAVTMVGVLPASAQIEEDVAAGYLNVSGTGHGGFGQLSVDMGRRWGVFGQVDATPAHDPGVDTTTYRDLGVLGAFGIAGSLHGVCRRSGSSASVSCTRRSPVTMSTFGAGPCTTPSR